VKRILWALSAYALGDEAWYYHTTGSTLLLTVFFIGTVCAIQQMVTRYPWQRS
jgi:hypothetical protein